MAPPINLSDRQLKVYLALEKNRMAWVAFWVVMALFVIGFGCAVYAIFWRPDIDWRYKTTLIAGDGLLGWCVKHIIQFLFNAPAPSTEPTA